MFAHTASPSKGTQTRSQTHTKFRVCLASTCLMQGAMCSIVPVSWNTGTEPPFPALPTSHQRQFNEKLKLTITGKDVTGNVLIIKTNDVVI